MLNKNNLTFYNEKAGGTNCSNATQLCSNSTVSGNSSGHGTQELNSGNRGCLSTEHQSSWYYIYIQNSGTLEMNITSSNSNDDYDFAIWGEFNISTAINNCPPINNPIRCSYSACKTSTGLGSGNGCRTCGFLGLFTCYETRIGNDTSEDSGGDSWLLPLNVSAGDVYLLLVDNYSASNSNYTITWGGTASLGCVVVNLGATIEYFNVTNNKIFNTLEFKTIRENNIDYFSILHSSDGIKWNQITKIQPSNTIDGNLYSFNYNTQYKHNYYQLKIVELDGNIETHDKILLIENEPIIFVKYYNIMGQEVSPDTKGFLLAIDINGNIHRIFR